MRFHGTLRADSVMQDDTVIKEIAKKFAGEGFITLSMENETNGFNDSNSVQQQLAIYRAMLNAKSAIKIIKKEKAGFRIATPFPL